MARFGSVGQMYFDDNGDPLAGGKLYFYETGTTTNITTYSDDSESTPNANPVILDANGRQGDIFFSVTAKVVLKTSADVQIDVADPVSTGLNAVVVTSMPGNPDPNTLYYVTGV